ncbi:hypothetical protein BJ138DRAFT_1170744 [Hygrophoropsis aurantiaca]|uniref:Uncharacterized protein n=1 Tax=Hygrophoropsis aurantiaca TaxID=72124 RepID=A0ACB8ALE2_9AGAM|nr:hypothetical protein BJ138DRAFT_1170744 [Hygrophoropsis aurantiaca]
MSTAVPRNPPLAGKPPFATDDPDWLFEQPPPSKRRVRKPADPNSRTSAYNMYDQYLDDDTNRRSGFGAVGLGFMTGDSDEEDNMARQTTDDKHAALVAATFPQTPQPIPLAAPRPGYPAPIAALDLPRPSPTSTPEDRQPPPQMAQVPQALRIHHPPAEMGAPRMPAAVYAPPSPRPSVPSTPHPLQPPMTPITPVFVRPTKSPAPRNVNFCSDTIMRGGSEDNLIPKRGEKGDDFWRRFSMVAKEEKKISPWLRKTQSGTTRLSRWVWFIGVVLLICIAGAAGLGWYISHKTPPNQAPKAIGGKSNESMSPVSSSAAAQSGETSSPHVSPTYTLARRMMPAPVPTGSPQFLQMMNLPRSLDDPNDLTPPQSPKSNSSIKQGKKFHRSRHNMRQY